MSGLGVVRVDMMVPDLYRNPEVWLDLTCQISEELLGELYYGGNIFIEILISGISAKYFANICFTSLSENLF